MLLCKRLGQLPYGGGLANQPARAVEKMILLENTLDAKRRLEGGNVE